MHHLLITTQQQWDAWAIQWNALARLNPMLSHDWLAAWWRNYGAGHQLHILAIEHDGQLLACLPAYLHHTPLGSELRWLGSGKASSDYMSVLIDQSGNQQSLQAVDSLWELLQENLTQGIAAGWRGVRLQGVSQSDSCVSLLTNRFGMRCEPMGNTWRIELPDTWQRFRERVKKHHCHRKINKFEQHTASGRLSVSMRAAPADTSLGMETLIKLHQLRRQELGEQGCFEDARFTRFLTQATEAMMKRGVARFLICSSDDQPIGIQLQLIGSDTLFIYQSGMDPSALKLEPGHALVASSLRIAIDEGFRAYDFLRGEEAYKAFWSAQPTPLLSLCGSVNSWKSRSLASIEKRLQWLKMLGKPSSQVSSKLP